MPEATNSLKLTVEEKICLHLLGYRNLGDEFVLPEDISQKGIARAIMVRRGHASVSLISLKNKGLVEEKIGRVGGSSRRRKVYFLTGDGLEEARKIMELVERCSIEVKYEGRTRSLQVREIERLVGRKVPLLNVVNALSAQCGIVEIDGSGRIVPAEESGGKEEPEGSDTDEEMGTDEKTDTKEEIGTDGEAGTKEETVKDEETATTQNAHCGKIRLRQILPVLGGVIISCLSLLFLYLYIEEKTEVCLSLFISIVLLVVFVLWMLSVIGSRSSGYVILRPGKEDMMIMGYILIVLSVYVQSLLRDDLVMEEIGSALLVVLPLFFLLNAKDVVPGKLNPEISGISGTLLFLYGFVQFIYPVFPGELHYPFLWVLSGYIMVLGGRPVRPSGKDSTAGNEWAAGKGSMMLVPSCTGAGLFILLSLGAGHEDLGGDLLSSLLVFFWVIFALALCSLRFWEDIEREIEPLLMSSILLSVGFIFFLATGIFLTLGKYVEGVVEALVGLLVLRYASRYVVPNGSSLVFISLFVVTALLTALSIYINI